MKIIVVNRYFHPDQAATSRMASALGFALIENGWSVHVVTGRCRHDSPGRCLPRSDIINGVKIHRVWTTAWGREHLLGRALDYVTFHMGACRRLLMLAARGDVCIVCTDPPFLSMTAAWPLAVRGADLINWLHDLFPEAAMELGMLPKRGLFAVLSLWLRDLSLRRAQLNVAPIPRMADHLKARGIDPRRLTVIRHWSQGDVIWPVETRFNGLRAEWGLKDKFVVGYSGNLGRAHEFETILQAARQLATIEDIVFLFVGGGHHRPLVEARSRALGLSNVMMKPLQPEARLAECLGVVDVHLVSLLPALETCIVPSKYYGIAAAGRPALFIGDPTGEIASVLGRGRCGASFAVGDVEGLARAIVKLRSSPTLRARMGTNARRLFETTYTAQRGAAEWHGLLQRSMTMHPATATGMTAPHHADEHNAPSLSPVARHPERVSSWMER